MSAKRDLLSITDFTPTETRQIIRRAKEGKGTTSTLPLQGKKVALLFEKPSLRTKVSFQVGIEELGGYSVYLSEQEVGLGGRESVSDIARVLSGYVDCIIARVFSHTVLEELAAYASVPVINALSDREHPCQILADVLTITEQKGDMNGLKLAYIGDGNNVARSLCLGLPPLGMSFTIASPKGYQLDDATLNSGFDTSEGGADRVQAMLDPAQAVQRADLVYTDVWASMGDEHEAGIRMEAFQGYTVNPHLLSLAKPDANFMHDMPAHYGEEVSEGMLEHPRSLAYQQAHNRLHAQKAVLEFLLA